MTCPVILKSLLYTCLLLFVHNSTIGNEYTSRSFNERYREVSNSLIVKDLKEARRVADSLVRISKTDEQRLKSYILLAKILEFKGETKESLSNALKADTISNSVINARWIATTSSYLSTTFRHLGLFETASKYIEKAEKMNQNLHDELEATLTNVNILHNQALLHIDKRNYNLAKSQSHNAARLLSKIDKTDNEITLLRATTDKLLGICEYKLGNFIDADSFLNSSIKKLEKFDCSLKPFIYRALAEVAIEREKFELALKYLQKVDQYLLKFEAEELKILTYNTWLKFYKSQGDFSSFLSYNSVLKELESNKNKNTIDILETVIHELKQNQDKNKVLFKHIIVIIISLVFIISSIIIVLNQKYRLVKIQAETTTPIKGNQDSKDANDQHQQSAIRNAKNINISVETTERLYNELLYQEKILFFLNNNISLQDLAREMGTNTRYVTYILHQFRGMSYYNYLQSTRIAYIKDRILKTPKLLNMKVSELANMCGFTTTSKFSVAFKEETGQTPSAFIQEIKEKNKKTNQN